MDRAAVAAHYTRGDLFERLSRALRDDGADAANPSLEALAPYDHFHGRGLEATEELAGALTVAPADELLDVGSGIGGPARYMAQRFGCRVTGIDLTAEFCDVAARLSALLGVGERTRFVQGDATRMPFESGRFAGAYSMNVAMNIAERAALYAEIARVLAPGGWFAMSEVARAGTGAVPYPMPWAASAEQSFLTTPEQTRRGLADAGFDIVSMRDTIEASRAYGARSRAIAEAGGKPLHRAVALIHGDVQAIMKNVAQAANEGTLVPIEIMARKR